MANNKKRLGDGPIEPTHREVMNEIARVLDTVFNGGTLVKDRKTGFILLVFPFGGEKGRCNYISNGADRRDVIVMLKEQIARFEGQAEASGTA